MSSPVSTSQIARPDHIPARNASVPSRFVVGNSDASDNEAQRSVVWGRRRLRGLGLAATAALLTIGAAPAALAGSPKPAASTSGQDVRVIVMSLGHHGSSKDAGDKVHKNHGEVVDDLDIADAVVADVSPDELADLAIDVAVEHPVKAVRAATGGRQADVVVDVTAKAPAALGQAVALARPGGTIVLAGTRGTDETPGFAPDHVVYKELTIVGALGVDVVAYRAAIEVLVSGRWPFEDLPRAAAGFDGVEGLLQAMAGETS